MDTKSKYQTVAHAEEQHLAAMSSAKTTSTKVKRTSKKSSAKVTAETVTRQTISKDEKTFEKVDTSEQGAAMLETVQKLKVPKKKKVSAAIAVADANVSNVEQQQVVVKQIKTATTIQLATETIDIVAATEETEPSTPPSTTTPTTADNEMNGKKKFKSKKSKKKDADRQNISVKSSFSKFDALQKRNLIHNPQSEKEINCRLCSKPVFKMEEIKAEKSIFHKNCFRCHECNKALKVDNYQSHESVLYCLQHFKLLFAPKSVEDTEPEKPRKPELIIRENQPIELPPDVVRASDKPDLGLDELSQLNVRSRFQVFENPNPSPNHNKPDAPTNTVKRSTSMLSKLAKLQTLGFAAGISVEDIAEHAAADTGSSNDVDDDDDDDDDDNDLDLVRSKKRTQRERPVGLGEAMNDIKTIFEKGHMLSKEERREERKQEIQNIRSRLFLGKQARIKEMYQQAVADSEQAITSVGKKPEIELELTARSLKERFENGEIFKDERLHTEDKNGHGAIQDEADVFESAISKKSRSIFMEIDANVAEGKNQTQSFNLLRNQSRTFNNRRNSENEQENLTAAVVKCDEKAEDVKIETSEISSKFKFFETYRPKVSEKKEFRITPPREGVVKMAAADTEEQPQQATDRHADTNQIEKSQTTSMMLNKFREMEKNKSKRADDAGPRPLKCFTPPPDGGKRLYQEQESDVDSQEDEGDDEEEEDSNDYEEEEHQHRFKYHENDEALKEAQAAARAKQLRAKFEKWEANQLERELNDGQIDIYSQQVSDDTTIESAKTIRERFENMKNTERKSPTRPRYQVNRFV